jgi:hypothetical protein
VRYLPYARSFVCCLLFTSPCHLPLPSPRTLQIRGLSGGQKVKLVLGAAMWQQPHILVLDEPTNYLDRESLGAMVSALNVSLFTTNNRCSNKENSGVEMARES